MKHLFTCKQGRPFFSWTIGSTTAFMLQDFIWFGGFFFFFQLSDVGVLFCFSLTSPYTPSQGATEGKLNWTPRSCDLTFLRPGPDLVLILVTSTWQGRLKFCWAQSLKRKQRCNGKAWQLEAWTGYVVFTVKNQMNGYAQLTRTSA